MYCKYAECVVLQRRLLPLLSRRLARLVAGDPGHGLELGQLGAGVLELGTGARVGQQQQNARIPGHRLKPGQAPLHDRHGDRHDARVETAEEGLDELQTGWVKQESTLSTRSRRWSSAAIFRACPVQLPVAQHALLRSAFCRKVYALCCGWCRARWRSTSTRFERSPAPHRSPQTIGSSYRSHGYGDAITTDGNEALRPAQSSRQLARIWVCRGPGAGGEDRSDPARHCPPYPRLKVKRYAVGGPASRDNTFCGCPTERSGVASRPAIARFQVPRPSLDR